GDRLLDGLGAGAEGPGLGFRRLALFLAPAGDDQGRPRRRRDQAPPGIVRPARDHHATMPTTPPRARDPAYRDGPDGSKEPLEAAPDGAQLIFRKAPIPGLPRARRGRSGSPSFVNRNLAYQEGCESMRTVDFSPLYRSVVGFDRLAALLDAAAA